MHLRLSDIAAGGQRLALREAAAVVLGLLEPLVTGAPDAGLPSLHDMLLDDRGRISFRRAGPEATERERVKQIAVLLQHLLRLEGSGVTSPNIPGAFLVLIARATGTLDLPSPSLVELRDALRRLAPSDRATRIALYRRHAVRAGGVAVPHTAAHRHAALAASLVIVALTGAWVLWPESREPRGRVQVVHERQTVTPTPSQAEPPAEPIRRAASRAATVATPVLLAESLGADVFSPAFAGDGRQLLFHAGRTGSALLQASFDVRNRPTVTTVLNDGAANYHATQSPDGRWLAFDSDRDGTRGVYVAPSDFRDALAARRVSGRGYAAVPRWSPDGRSLAFARAELRRPRVWNVWIANLDAGTLSRVSDHRVGQAWSASWFPSGERLAYSVEDSLVVVDLGRGTRRRFQSPRPGHLVRTPAVSPDGRWIVFQVHRDGTWLFDVSSERMRRVLDDPRAEEFSWSPDGRRVLYHTKGRAGWSVWQFALPPGA